MGVFPKQVRDIFRGLENGEIIRVRAYLDSAMVGQLFAENPLE